MTIEVPVLRLEWRGATSGAAKQAADAAAPAACASLGGGAFADADAWWLEGSRTVLLLNEHLRVQPAWPPAFGQLALADVDRRPVAFSLPIAAPGFKPAVTFPLSDQDAAPASCTSSPTG